MAIMIVMVLSWLTCADTFGEHRVPDTGDEPLTVSLVTCYPGSEIFELYGHEAIRVRGAGIDSVWNFGIFNFNEPNFVYRFVKGETDYLCAGYPFEYFLPEYYARGSKVVEQDLNLSEEESRRLLGMLRWQALPENRRYRYNYVKDNCATRIIDMIDAATLEEKPVYPDSIRFGTYREAMRYYNRNYPWYQLGIDIALGSGIDSRITGREEMFVPVEMERKVANAHFRDGRAMVKAYRELNPGQGDVTLPPTPWYLAPLTWGWIAGLLLTGVSLSDIFRKRVTRWIYTLWFFIIGTAGSVVAFLVFLSSHEATAPNTLILWLNPLQLLMAICVWPRLLRPLATALSYYDILATLLMLIVWPFQPQSCNPALFPLMGGTLALSVAYAINSRYISYNNNKPVGAKKKQSTVKRKTRKK